MKVIMLKQTNFNGLKFKDKEYEIDDIVAKRWIKNRIALPSLFQSKTLEEPIPFEPTEEIDEEETIESIAEEDDVFEETENEETTADYETMTPKQLYFECKNKGIKVAAKQPAEFYIKKLVEFDEIGE